MSMKRKLVISNTGGHNTPRCSTVSQHQGLLRGSLNLSKRDNISEIDRSQNVSQATERLRQSPRVLNSQKNSPRHQMSNALAKSIRQSLKETSSFLDTNYKSLAMSEKPSTLIQNRKEAKNKSVGFAFSFYKTPKNDHFNDSIVLAKISPSKKTHFLEYYLKRKSYVPSPDKYEVRGSMIMSGDK